jgi:hypothetical protein
MSKLDKLYNAFDTMTERQILIVLAWCFVNHRRLGRFWSLIMLDVPGLSAFNDARRR